MRRPLVLLPWQHHPSVQRATEMQLIQCKPKKSTFFSVSGEDSHRGNLDYNYVVLNSMWTKHFFVKEIISTCQMKYRIYIIKYLWETCEKNKKMSTGQVVMSTLCLNFHTVLFKNEFSVTCISNLDMWIWIKSDNCRNQPWIHVDGQIWTPFHTQLSPHYTWPAVALFWRWEGVWRVGMSQIQTWPHLEKYHINKLLFTSQSSLTILKHCSYFSNVTGWEIGIRT